MRRSKAVLKGKLKDTRTVDVADGLARAEVRIGYEITKLLESHSIATRGADGVVLDRIYSCAILNVKVGAVEDIEGARFELQVQPFGELEDLGECHVCIPLTRTLKGVASQVAYATKARAAQAGQVRCARRYAGGAARVEPITTVTLGVNWAPSICPSVAREGCPGDAAVGTVVLVSVEVEVATQILAVP